MSYATDRGLEKLRVCGSEKVKLVPIQCSKLFFLLEAQAPAAISDITAPVPPA